MDETHLCECLAAKGSPTWKRNGENFTVREMLEHATHIGDAFRRFFDPPNP